MTQLNESALQKVLDLRNQHSHNNRCSKATRNTQNLELKAGILWIARHFPPLSSPSIPLPSTTASPFPPPTHLLQTHAFHLSVTKTLIEYFATICLLGHTRRQSTVNGPLFRQPANPATTRGRLNMPVNDASTGGTRSSNISRGPRGNPRRGTGAADTARNWRERPGGAAQNVTAPTHSGFVQQPLAPSNDVPVVPSLLASADITRLGKGTTGPFVRNGERPRREMGIKAFSRKQSNLAENDVAVPEFPPDDAFAPNSLLFGNETSPQRLQARNVIPGGKKPQFDRSVQTPPVPPKPAYRSVTVESASDDEDPNRISTPSYGHISPVPSTTSSPVQSRSSKSTRRPSNVSSSGAWSRMPLPELDATSESCEDLLASSEVNTPSPEIPDGSQVIASFPDDDEGIQVELTRDDVRLLHRDWKRLKRIIEPGELEVRNRPEATNIEPGKLLEHICPREDCREIRNTLAEVLASQHSYAKSMDTFALAILFNQLLRKIRGGTSAKIRAPPFTSNKQDCLTKSWRDPIITSLYNALFRSADWRKSTPAPPITPHDFHAQFQTMVDWRNLQAHQVSGRDIALAIQRTYGTAQGATAPRSIMPSGSTGLLLNAIPCWDAGMPFTPRAFADFAFKAVVNVGDLTPEDYIRAVNEESIVDEYFEDEDDLKAEGASSKDALSSKDRAAQRQYVQGRYENIHTKPKEPAVCLEGNEVMRNGMLYPPS